MANNGPIAAPAQGAAVLRAVQEPAQQNPAAAPPVVPQANPAQDQAGAQNQGADAGASPALDTERKRQQKLQKDKEWYDKWKSKFEESFKAEGWALKNVDHQKDKKFVWEKPGNLNVTIEISEAEDESKIVSFSGTAHHEIAHAATNYLKEMAPTKTIKFIVEAANDDDAVNFMKGLVKEQFNLDLIKDLKINNTDKGIEYTAQLVARAKQEFELEKQQAAAQAPRAGGPGS